MKTPLFYCNFQFPQSLSNTVDYRLVMRITGIIFILLIMVLISSVSALPYKPAQMIQWTIPDTNHTQPDLVITSDSATIPIAYQIVQGQYIPESNATYIGYNSYAMWYELPFIQIDGEIIFPILEVPYTQPNGLVM